MKRILSLILMISFLNVSFAGGYISLSADQKRDALWENIEKTEYDVDQRPQGYHWFSMAKLFNPHYLTKSFSHKGDRMQKGRVKIIHTRGSTAKVKFVPAKTQYTGLLSETSLGLMRISLAIPTPSFTPGMAIKFFIDGKESLNIFAMHSLDGQGTDMNLFAHNWSNKIPVPETVGPKVLAVPFKKAMKLIDPDGSAFHLPSTKLFEVSRDGTVVDNPVSASILTFVPQVKGSPSNTKRNLVEQLDILKEGTTLFKVFAKNKVDDSGQFVGSIVLESRFIASKDGDENLYFRH